MTESAAIPIRAALLSIGDELLLGEITDTNAPHIAQRLLSLGITVAGAETVGDEMDDIVAAFQRALARAPIVLATGGLGPTDDDLTLAALAKAVGVELEFCDEVMVQMAERLKRPMSAFNEASRKQAWLPKGAVVLRNDWGTAPGVHLPTANQRHVFLMPGVPREMRGLLDERILPILRTLFPAPEAIVVKTLHSFGIPESIVGERIKPLMEAGRNPNVGTRVAGGVVSVRLVATAPSEAAARELLAPALAQVRVALEDACFGEDGETLAQAALRALLEQKKTVALAESCTGGLVAKLLTDTSGSSAAVLEGAVVYSNEAKMRTCSVRPETLAAHGAVSAETARELAAGIRVRAGADIGLGVTGIAGPTGGSAAKPVGLVHFAVATAAGVQAHERNYFGYDRETVRQRAAMQAMDFIRRAVLAT
jgi:nicotinamide-nucleotide amidase